MKVEETNVRDSDRFHGSLSFGEEDGGKRGTGPICVFIPKHLYIQENHREINNINCLLLLSRSELMIFSMVKMFFLVEGLKQTGFNPLP